MSSHVELNPDDDVLGLTLGMKAMRLALTQKTHKMGTVRIPGADGTDVIIGAGASDGVNRVDKDGRQLPLVDTSGIDKAAQDAQRKADDAIAKADEAIKQGEQIRRDAQAGIDDARKAAQDAAVKADKVRSDLTRQVQNVKSEMDSTVKAAQSSANKAQSAADAAQKAADKANASTADLDKSIKAVDAKAIAAKQAAAEAQSKAENVASDLDSANAVIEQHTTELGTLTTKVSNAVTKSDSALSVSTEAKQTATEASTTASSAYKDSQTALTQSTTATQTATAAKTTAESASKTATDSLKQSSAAVQTANQISTTLRTEYQTKADADKIYATQSSLKQTSDSITASVSKTYATKDALSSLQNIADNAIESWRGTGVPTLTNKPASDWTTSADKRKHSGDLYYDKSTGKAYRFGSDDGTTYTWELNQDTDVTKALADASKAQTSANNAQASATAANTAAGKAQSTANTAVSNAATAKNAADAAQSSANKAQGDVDKLKIDIPETYATKSSLTQTAESITANVESVKTTANSAVTAASKAQQTADGISVNLTKNYQTKSQADTIYATKASLNATSDSISAEVTKAQGTADGAVTAASKAQQTADAVTLNLSKNYQTKAQNDALYATQTSLNATSDSLSAKITANAKTAQSAVDKATNLEANLNGFKTTVSQTYTTKTDFDNLTVGGTNLLVKSNFIKTWLDTVNGTLIHPDASVSGSEYNGDSSSKKPITVDPNTTYVLSAYDSMTDTVANTGRISQFDSEGTFIKFVVPGIDLRDKGHITFTTDENAASILVGIYSFPRYRWKLEKGTKPTDWSPAPEDLQSAGDYATKSSLTQTANSIKAQVTEVSKTANGAMSKATTVEQTANGLSSKITEQAKTLNATVRTANEAKSTADSNKATISQVSTTASSALTKASTVEQNLNGFKTAVSQTYGRGSNLWVNPTFDPDKPQIASRVNNVTAPNGSGVNLLAHRDHYNGNTSFPVVPGHTYVITAHIKRIKGNLPLNAGIWYTAQTSGTSWDDLPVPESTSDLSDGWIAATWRTRCPNGKSRGCVDFHIEQLDSSIQFYISNVVCVDVTGLQPAGDYATNSSLTQTANSIKAQVSEVAKTASGAMGKASSVEQTASGLSMRISEVAKKGDQTVQSLNTLSADVTGFKQSVQQTYATGARVSQLESSLDGFKSTVSQTYSPKSEVTNLAASTVRRYRLNMIGEAAWYKIGYWQPIGQGSVAAIHVYAGSGTNGSENQNSEFTIMLKKGWTGSSNNHKSDYGVNLIRQRNAANVQVKALTYHPGRQDPETTPVDIWIYQPWGYGGGHYDVSYDGSWSNMTTVQKDAPVEDSTHTLQSSVGYETLSNTSYVDQTSRSVSLGVVEEYKQGRHGSALATQSDITVAKNSITSTVASTYATKSGVTQEISSKITQNNNSLDVKFSTKTETKTAQDTANTAKSNASNAQSRVGALEDCISLTSAGVRAGHKSNGVFNGVSALVNTDGSFDLLDKDGNLLTRIDRHSLQVAGDDGVGSGHLILSQDGLDITVQPTANKKATYHIQLGAGGISITAPDGSHVNCSARTGLDLETVRYGKLSIGSGGLQFTNDQGWGLLLSAAGWSLKWAGNHTLATGPTAGKLYIDGREIMTR